MFDNVQVSGLRANEPAMSRMCDLSEAVYIGIV